MTQFRDENYELSLAHQVTLDQKSPERRTSVEGREVGTCGRARKASLRPHQSIDKVQNPNFSVIG